MDYLFLAAGVGLLYLGGEGLVRGASSMGRSLGLSPIVIGLTVVSIGTSSPELAASLAGVIEGAPAVAFGNVVGSNIANLGLVLGLTGLIWPPQVASQFIRREMPFMLLFSASTFWLVLDEWIGRVEGGVLLAVLVAYIAYLLRREPEPEVRSEFETEVLRLETPVGLAVVFVLGGIGLLVLGAHLLVTGAVNIARDLGVTERVIGLTMVAFGTSLPELASSLVAAFKREGDLVLGNLIGSNIFNILFILGGTAMVRPIAVETASVWVDLWVMMAVGLVTWLFFATGPRLTRWEGLILVAGYGTYTVWLFL